ncbi:MAG: RHS repeat-associated core domain-containing protein, partial [Planctomycetes bacterium]|nr:RHS repeat-associated core domain-containing protein [Planctomycetota bacterium]
GTKAEYTYDSLNRLTYLVNRDDGGGIISSYQYTLGPAGNRTRVEEHSGRVINYTYDDLYRLTREDISDPVNGAESIVYTYDPFGNRLTKSNSSGTIDYTYDENDRLTSEAGPNGTTTYTYDDNGNNLSKSNVGESNDYYYDYENRLFEVQTGTDIMEYDYDADGIRVSSTKNSIVTNYLVDKNRDYAQVLEEKDEAGNLQVEYVHGDDLVSQNRSGDISYYHYDGLGSTRAWTDDSAAVTDTYIYEAFGELVDHTGDTPNIYLYTGEQFDVNVGFYYLRARYYAPGIGRFVTHDPWGGNIFDPVSLHKYNYAKSNPVHFKDPTGMFFLLVNQPVALSIRNALATTQGLTGAQLIDITVNNRYYLNNPNGEVYFRKMSPADYKKFRLTGRIPPTHETFITPNHRYLEKFKSSRGVTVRFVVRPGTTRELLNIGVRDKSNIVKKKYG